MRVEGQHKEKKPRLGHCRSWLASEAPGERGVAAEGLGPGGVAGAEGRCGAPGGEATLRAGCRRVGHGTELRGWCSGA